MDSGLEWWRWLGLLAIFGGLGAFWWWARGRAIVRPAAGRGAEGLRVVERKFIDGRTCVSVVEYEGRRWLLAHQAGGAVAWQSVEGTPHQAPP